MQVKSPSMCSCGSGLSHSVFIVFEWFFFDFLVKFSTPLLPPRSKVLGPKPAQRSQEPGGPLRGAGAAAGGGQLGTGLRRPAQKQTARRDGDPWGWDTRRELEAGSPRFLGSQGREGRT